MSPSTETQDEAASPGSDADPSAPAVTSSASANPNPTDEGLSMYTAHVPQPLSTTVKLASKLRLNSAAHELPDDQELKLADAVLPLLNANVELHQVVLDRLFVLWNAVTAVGADEISAWQMDTTVTLGWVADVPPEIAAVQPAPIMVGATVFADGEVSFAVMIDIFQTPLWFSEMLVLPAFEQHA